MLFCFTQIRDFLVIDFLVIYLLNKYWKWFICLWSQCLLPPPINGYRWRASGNDAFWSAFNNELEQQIQTPELILEFSSTTFASNFGWWWFFLPSAVAYFSNWSRWLPHRQPITFNYYPQIYFIICFTVTYALRTLLVYFCNLLLYFFYFTWLILGIYVSTIINLCVLVYIYNNLLHILINFLCTNFYKINFRLP